MAKVDVDGVALYWEEGGAGDPLLLIQGLGFSADMWFRITPALEERYRVIRYDARGIGRSDVPPGPYPIALMASDAMAVLDAAGVDSAHVFGASLGGIVAQEVALSYPDRTTSLTLCCTHAPPATIWPEPAVMEMLATRGQMTTEDAARASIPYGYATTTDRDAIEEDIRRRLANPTSGTGYEGQLFAGIGYPGTMDRLGNLEMPVLVVTGDADLMVPPVNSELMVAAIPGAELVVIPGAGHVVFTDAPGALTDAMVSFLAGVAAP